VVNYFKDLLNPVDVNTNVNGDDFPAMLRNPNIDILNMPITDEEIIRSVNTLKSNRSPGNDGICLKMYKNTIYNILPYLNHLFNEI